MPVFHIPIRDYPIIIECPSHIAGFISASVFSARIESVPNGTKLRYRIIEEHDRFYLYRNSRLTHRNRDLSKIVFALEWQVVEDLLKSLKDDLQFHAAVLAKDGQGYVFLGDSGTGKTSLAIALQRLGWQLLSDEFAILQPLLRTVHPFPRNLIIKPHLREIIAIRPSELRIMIDDFPQKKIPAYFIDPRRFGEVAPDLPLPLRKIFILEHHPDGEFSIQSLGQSAGFEQLADKLFNKHLLSRYSPDILLQLLGRQPVFRLALNNPLLMARDQLQNLCHEIQTV